MVATSRPPGCGGRFELTTPREPCQLPRGARTVSGANALAVAASTSARKTLPSATSICAVTATLLDAATRGVHPRES